LVHEKAEAALRALLRYVCVYVCMYTDLQNAYIGAREG
jgi:hypothetical protein